MPRNNVSWQKNYQPLDSGRDLVKVLWLQAFSYARLAGTEEAPFCTGGGGLEKSLIDTFVFFRTKTDSGFRTGGRTTNNEESSN
jgi:hypothetical protein